MKRADGYYTDVFSDLTEHGGSCLVSGTTKNARLETEHIEYRVNLSESDKLFFALFSKVKSDWLKFSRNPINKEKLNSVIIGGQNYGGSIHFVRAKYIKEKFEGYKLDMSAAYWSEAKKLFLSEETYALGVPDPKGSIKRANKIKKARLHALGALAVNYYSYNFSGGEISNYKNEQSKTAFVFKYIYNRICEICLMCCEDYPNILGFWVDCFFWHGSSETRVDEFIRYFEFMYDIKLKKEKCHFEKIKEGRSYYIQSKNELGEIKRYFVE
jgi:hypothetical protein